MKTFWLIFGVACIALVVYLVAEITVKYVREKEKTGWERWRAAARDSATMLWGKIGLLAGGIAGGLPDMAQFLGDPSLSSWAQAHINDARTLSTVLLVFSWGSILSRMRTLGKSDN